MRGKCATAIGSLSCTDQMHPLMAKFFAYLFFKKVGVPSFLPFGGFMYRFYQKSKLWFALACIGIYVIGSSAADALSDLCGAPKSITLLFHLALSFTLIVFLFRHGLWREYGICKPNTSHKRFLFYIPLAVMASCNLWIAPTLQQYGLSAVCYVASMLCVGLLEELIFRGLLFRAMEQVSLRAAVIVSSLTFGLGHLVNLLNGSAESLVANLCQVVTAICFGFLFVFILHRGDTLLPCILTHSILNGLSVVCPPLGNTEQVLVSLALSLLALGYLAALHYLLPKKKDA